MRTTTIAVGLLAAVLLVGGCGSDSGSDGGGDAANPGGEQPGGEQPGANGEVDAPNPGSDQPSATLPGLPIGGTVPDTVLTTDSPSGCGSVRWVGPGELIPEGIEVEITDFDPPDQVSVDDSACAGTGPSCLGGVTFRPGQTSCVVGVRWNGETPETLSLIANGMAYCDDQAACDEFKRNLVPQTAMLVIDASEPEPEPEDGDEIDPEDGDSLVTPSMSEPPSDGTE